MIDRLFDPRMWQELLRSDFNRGYVAALVLVLALLLAMLILKFLCWLAFRTRRCSEITIPRRDGDIVVSREAVAAAVERELRAFPELNVRKIRLFRRRRAYLMTLCCAYGGGDGVPALADELKPRLLSVLKTTFGIETMKRIKVVIEKLDGSAPEPLKAVTPAERTPPAPTADVSAGDASAAVGK